MTENKNIEKFNPTGWRFRLGLLFFVMASIFPLFIPFVTSSNLSTEMKTLLSTFLVIGAPEIFSVISIIIMGKQGFNYIKYTILSFLKQIAPSAEVSRRQYKFGLFLLLLHVIFSYFIFYAPDLIVGYAENRITMNLIADFLFIVTLFVLGGEFWEKLRALFIYDAKACIPERK